MKIKMKTLTLLSISCVIIVALTVYLVTPDIYFFQEAHYSHTRLGTRWIPDRWVSIKQNNMVWSLVVTSMSAMFINLLVLKMDWIDWEPLYTGENQRKHEEYLEELKMKNKG